MVKLQNLFLAGFLLMVSCAGERNGKEELAYQFPQPEQYVCFRSTGDIMIDGVLNENDWENAQWTQEFRDIEGDKKPIPRHQTKAKMLWDDHYLYVAAWLEEPHIWAKLKQRDTVIFYDNDFEVFIDPNGDTHQYYELEVNAIETLWDLFLVKPYRDGGPAMDAWDVAGIKVATEIYGSLNDASDIDSAWTVEMAIPFSVLEECAPGGRPPLDGEQWRLGFSRVEWDIEIVDGNYRKKKDPETGKVLPENNWVWSPQGYINMHMPEYWGFVQFSKESVLEGSQSFVFVEDEKVKWLLRDIYSAQAVHYENKGVYARSLEELGMNLVADYAAPEMFVSPSMYEVVMKSKTSGLSWHIRQDGLVWSDNK